MRKPIKLFVTLLSASLLVSSCLFASAASISSNTYEKVIFQAKPITNFDELKERAQQGINDDKNLKLPIKKGDSFYTSQLIKETKSGAQVAMTYMATTYQTLTTSATSTAQSGKVHLWESFNYTVHYYVEDGLIAVRYYSVNSLSATVLNAGNTAVKSLYLGIGVLGDEINLNNGETIASLVDGSVSKTITSPVNYYTYRLDYPNPNTVWYINPYYGECLGTIHINDDINNRAVASIS
jgi:hypothetical protein